jgi:hypothetical protein
MKTIILVRSALCSLVSVLSVIGAATAQANDPLEPLNYEPPNRGAPERTEDAGSRPGCPESEIPFTAVMPTTNWGETLSDRPSFWFYVPNGASQVEVVITDSRDRIVGQTTAEIAEADGIVAVEWDGEPLAVNQFYQWQAFFLCDPEDSESYLSAGGGLLRRDGVEPEFETERDRLLWLAEEGLWFDTVTQLAELQQSDPEDLQWQTDWEALLSDPIVGLDTLLQEPILISEPLGE